MDQTAAQLKAMQKTLTDLTDRVKGLADQVENPDHYHNGFDSNRIAYTDLTGKKIYIHHVLYGTDAATAGNYGTFFIVPVACLITAIKEVHEVLGTDGSAVTLQIEKLTSTTVPGSGSSILSTAFDLKAAINTVRSGTLVNTAATISLAAGDRLALKKSGTLTSVAGVTVDVELQF